MEVNLSPRFKRVYKKLPKEVKNDFDSKISLFIGNPRNPTLKTHKLKGKLQSCLSFYLRDGYRVLFEFENTHEINLLDIGPHDKYYSWKR